MWLCLIPVPCIGLLYSWISCIPCFGCSPICKQICCIHTSGSRPLWLWICYVHSSGSSLFWLHTGSICCFGPNPFRIWDGCLSNCLLSHWLEGLGFVSVSPLSNSSKVNVWATANLCLQWHRPCRRNSNIYRNQGSSVEHMHDQVKMAKTQQYVSCKMHTAAALFHERVNCHS